MPLTVLSNKNIQHLLLDLRKEDLHQMMERLREALDEYSLRKSKEGCSADNQPESTAVEASNGTTTLFMPATSSTYLGMKGENELRRSIEQILTIGSCYSGDYYRPGRK